MLAQRGIDAVALIAKGEAGVSCSHLVEPWTEDDTKAVMEAVAASTTLKRLRLHSLPQPMAQHFALAARTNTSLEELQLISCDLTGDEGKRVASVCAAWPSLRWLVSETGGWNDDCASILAKAPQLKRLSLRYETMGDAAMTELRHGLDKWTQLDFSYCPNLTAVGVKALGEALAHPDCVLTLLSMPDSKIGEDGIVCLAKALEANRSLAALVLNSTPLSTAACAALASLLRTTTTLKSLTIFDEDLGKDAFKELIAALPDNKSLTSFSTLCKLDEEQSAFLCDMLRPNSTLREFGVDGCTGSMQGVHEALKANVDGETYFFVDGDPVDGKWPPAELFP